MKKKIIIITSIIIGIILLTVLGINIYNKWRIANAKILVELVDTLEVEVFQDAKLSDFIKSINGKIEDDFIINTTKTGGINPLLFYV